MSRGLVAVASEARVKTDPGQVVFFSARTLEPRGAVTVGALPDMLTFADEGEYLLVANEAEPNEDYSIDPEGTISIIDLEEGVSRATVRTVDFRAYVGREDALRASGIRIFGKLRDGTPSNAAQDFEPEYIAVEGNKAYVSLQENNAVAVVDIRRARVEKILPLGFKDHNRTLNDVAVNPLDASDRDTANSLKAWPVYGMFQPDGIATLKVRGKVYLLTANEGDARVYPTAGGIVPNGTGGFLAEGAILNEESRVGSSGFPLDPLAFPTAATLKAIANLGRLNATNTLGRNPSGQAFDRIYAFGARSFSVWDTTALASTTLPSAPNAGLVWDSAAQFETVTAAQYPDVFNASNSNNNRDDRSDNKGPEPEGIVVARLGGRDFAFVGLERIGGVMLYDVSKPTNPVLVQYLNTRNFLLSPTAPTNATGPEGLAFVDAEKSPTGRPLLLVGNEVSQTMTVFEIQVSRTED